MEYLGHIVSHESVKVDPNKIKPMMEWLIHKTLKNIRGFLGLTGYYHKFIENYGQITTPPTCAIEKGGIFMDSISNQIFSKTLRGYVYNSYISHA